MRKTHSRWRALAALPLLSCCMAMAASVEATTSSSAPASAPAPTATNVRPVDPRWVKDEPQFNALLPLFVKNITVADLQAKVKQYALEAKSPTPLFGSVTESPVPGSLYKLNVLSLRFASVPYVDLANFVAKFNLDTPNTVVSEVDVSAFGQQPGIYRGKVNLNSIEVNPGAVPAAFAGIKEMLLTQLNTFSTIVSPAEAFVALDKLRPPEVTYTRIYFHDADKLDVVFTASSTQVAAKFITTMREATQFTLDTSKLKSETIGQGTTFTLSFKINAPSVIQNKKAPAASTAKAGTPFLL